MYKKFFNMDNPFWRGMGRIFDVFVLNVLWLLCCLPVLTAGAATTAMYSVLFQYITDQDNEVLKPFLRAFRENFAQATPLWFLNLLVGLALGAEAFYLISSTQIWLKGIWGALLFIYAGASSYLYPLLARYDSPRKKALFNSFALSLRHLFSTVCVVILNALPLVLVLFAPAVFWRTILWWTLAGFSVIGYFNGKILWAVFRRYEPKQE